MGEVSQQLQIVLWIGDATDRARGAAHKLQCAGYVVARASDGESALGQHAVLRPDMVILDGVPGGSDGEELLRRLRDCVATPVLVLTAHDGGAEAARALALGANDWIVWPDDMSVLAARVAELLGRREAARLAMDDDRRDGPSLLRSGALHVYTAARLATLSGVPLDLSPSAFDLLCLLLRHPGRALSRDYILATLWGEAHNLDQRAVDRVVRRLRVALGAVGGRIEAVWGTGYRWRGGG